MFPLRLLAAAEGAVSPPPAFQSQKTCSVFRESECSDFRLRNAVTASISYNAVDDPLKRDYFSWKFFVDTAESGAESGSWKEIRPPA